MSASPIPTPDEVEAEVAHAALAQPTLAHAALAQASVAQAGALRWTSTMMATAVLFLFALNAEALKDWAWSLKPNDITVAGANLASRWEAMTARVGLAAPRRQIHDAWAWGRSLRFPQGTAPATRPPADVLASARPR